MKNLIATLIAIGKTRVELFLTELEEEKHRLMSLWAKAIGAAFFLAVGIIMAVFCLALAFWEHRVLFFGMFAVLFICSALVLLVSLRKQMNQHGKLFQASIAELESDMAQLRSEARDQE